MNTVDIVNMVITVWISLALIINIVLGFIKCKESRLMYWFGLFSGVALILELFRNVILK